MGGQNGAGGEIIRDLVRFGAALVRLWYGCGTVVCSVSVCSVCSGMLRILWYGMDGTVCSGLLWDAGETLVRLGTHLAISTATAPTQSRDQHRPSIASRDGTCRGHRQDIARTSQEDVAVPSVCPLLHRPTVIRVWWYRPFMSDYCPSSYLERQREHCHNDV